MKTEQNNLDRLKGKNPFTVPEGYMEGLTANIMSQLPEREPEEEVKKVSLMDRVRPWLYMAAVFAGLGLFFKVLAFKLREGWRRDVGSPFVFITLSILLRSRSGPFLPKTYPLMTCLL